MSGHAGTDSAVVRAATVVAAVAARHRRRSGAVVACQRHVETDRLAGDLAQDRLDAAGVLIANPVELEAIGNPHRDDGSVALVVHFGIWQGPDPGVELLVGQLGRQAFAATLPEVGSHVWRSGPEEHSIV